MKSVAAIEMKAPAASAAWRAAAMARQRKVAANDNEKTNSRQARWRVRVAAAGGCRVGA
jgi:hypothetical protein